MKPKSSGQLKAEYQQTIRIAEEKKALRDAAKKAHEEAQEVLDLLEAKAAQQATELFKAIGAEALEAPAESGPAYLDVPIPAPIRASNLKRGESIRLAPGQSIVFEGGAELCFQSGRFLTNFEVAKIMQAVRDAKGGSSEPPPSGM